MLYFVFQIFHIKFYTGNVYMVSKSRINLPILNITCVPVIKQVKMYNDGIFNFDPIMRDLHAYVLFSWRPNNMQATNVLSCLPFSWAIKNCLCAIFYPLHYMWVITTFLQVSGVSMSTCRNRKFFWKARFWFLYI